MTLPTAAPVVVVARRLLLPHFPGIPIGPDAPADPWPTRFIRIDRGGGPRDWAIDRARVLVECWATTHQQAAADADLAYAALEQCADDRALYWEGGNIVRFNDPARRSHHRYQFTGTLGISIL